MPISRTGSGSSGAYDYVPMMKNGSVTTSSTIGQYTTFLSVTGKGLLHKLVWGGLAGQIMKVTVDGNVIFWVENTGGNYSGIIPADEIFYNSTAGNYMISGGTAGNFLTLFQSSSWVTSFPLATKQNIANPHLVVSMPIKFNSSLLIEMASSSTSGSTIVHGCSYSIGQ